MIERSQLNRFEKIIFDTLQCWQENRRYSWKQKGNETFEFDELLEVIAEYGPWSSKDRELPISAITSTLSWFEKEALIRKLGEENWEILLSV